MTSLLVLYYILRLFVSCQHIENECDTLIEPFYHSTVVSSSIGLYIVQAAYKLTAGEYLLDVIAPGFSGNQ